MKLNFISCVLLSLIPVTYASFQVILHDDPNCRGTVLSTHTLTVEDGCQTFGVGLAQGASLERDLQIGNANSVDERGTESDTLLFYDTPSCNSTSGNIIASTDKVCVAIGGIIRDQNFQSFRLVSPAMSKAGEHMGWKANNAALLSHGLTWEDLENQSGETHGRIFVTGGTVYRYQQLSRGSGVGIPLEEWDEELHVKHDEV